MDALVVIFIISFIIVYKVNKAAQEGYSDSAAGRWAARVEDEYEQDTMSFLERRRVKKNCLMKQGNLKVRQSMAPGMRERHCKDRPKSLDVKLAIYKLKECIEITYNIM